MVADTLNALLPDSLRGDSLTAMAATTPDSLDAEADTVADRALLKATSPQKPSAITLKRDTTTMDSLELAIWKHNKAIDDSLRLDSINRQKKNGIDSPVEFAAEDSLIYEAGAGMAHLFGDAHVKYQNMDLQSERIYMCLDSSLVHATGARDTLGQLFGTPVFKMGNDTYENDTMAFNF